MKVLILGGTGAMGKPLVEILANQGLDVYVTSRKRRTSNLEKIHYLYGNAHDISFVSSVLKDHYDVMIDFMSYTLREFEQRVSLFLSSVGQYIFLSSCRVYAESSVSITEESPRLLDMCKDEEYIAPEEYALAKAREENILYASEYENWTIVRPTITYNSHRLQLGCYELEHWLYRALRGRPIVFFDDLLEKKTPMTYGEDVARGISYLIGCQAALSETVQIATPETMKWKDILKLYVDVLDDIRGGSAPVCILPHAEKTAEILGRKWQLKYNRIYDRVFDSTKIDTICGVKIQYTPIKDGLRCCLEEFLQGGDQ